MPVTWETQSSQIQIRRAWSGVRGVSVAWGRSFSAGGGNLLGVDGGGYCRTVWMYFTPLNSTLETCLTLYVLNNFFF